MNLIRINFIESTYISVTIKFSSNPSSTNCICMKWPCARRLVFQFVLVQNVWNILLWMFNFSGFYEQNSRRRQIANMNRSSESAEIGTTIYEDPNNEARNNQWRRILLLVVAITVYFCEIINNYANYLM